MNFLQPPLSKEQVCQNPEERYLRQDLAWETPAPIHLSVWTGHYDSHSALFLQAMTWILHHILCSEAEITIENTMWMWSPFYNSFQLTVSDKQHRCHHPEGHYLCVTI